MRNPHPLQALPSNLDEVPAKIDVALRMLHYCRSVTDPQSVGLAGQQRGALGHVARSGRALTQLEKGAENAALNLLRNYLTGEVQLGAVDLHLSFGSGFAQDAAIDECGFENPDAAQDGPENEGEAA